MLVTKLPTAMQSFLETQDTPLRAGSIPAAALGVRWIDQRTPFQRSTRGNVPSPAAYSPTAVQAAADVHETPARRASAVAGLAVVWIDQCPPRHRSAKVRTTPEPSV